MPKSKGIAVVDQEFSKKGANLDIGKEKYKTNTHIFLKYFVFYERIQKKKGTNDRGRFCFYQAFSSLAGKLSDKSGLSPSSADDDKKATDPRPQGKKLL